MHPSHFFSSSNVLIVAGKGGVGKTVTAAAVATALPGAHIGGAARGSAVGDAVEDARAVVLVGHRVEVGRAGGRAAAQTVCSGDQ